MTATPARDAWFLLRSGPGAAAANMALDAALLEAGPALPGPVLRFYAWTEPAATFGYFQKFAEVEKMTLLRPLIRRPTGGGLVPHDADWTYSLVIPPGHEWYALSATDSYHRMHEWIRAAFLKLGAAAELAPSCRRALPGRCFAGHERFDVLWRDRKIAGAAQRRTRGGLLIQGSVQPPPLGLARAGWELAMRETAPLKPGGAWHDFALTPALARRREELAAGVYSQATHNCRR
jgi:lipoate-protein ligase A